MVQIIVPLSGKTLRPAVAARQQAGLIAVIFKNEMDFAIGDLAADGFPDLGDNVRAAVVINRVHRIKAQPVEMVFFEPVKCIVDKVVAHYPVMRGGEIDRGSPRRVAALGKEVWRDRRQVIPLWAEMIVNHIEQDREPARMARLD